MAASPNSLEDLGSVHHHFTKNTLVCCCEVCFAALTTAQVPVICLKNTPHTVAVPEREEQGGSPAHWSRQLQVQLRAPQSGDAVFTLPAA